MRQGLELHEVGPAAHRLADLHDVGGGVAPRQEVGVVLVRPDEDHRPLLLR